MRPLLVRGTELADPTADVRFGFSVLTRARWDNLGISEQLAGRLNMLRNSYESVQSAQSGPERHRHIGLLRDLLQEVFVVGHGQRIEVDRLQDR
jgi:hypothetical protein